MPVVLDRRDFRVVGCGARYPGPECFPTQSAGPVLSRSLRGAGRPGLATALGLTRRPATAVEEIAWAFADELRGRYPGLGVAVHSPSLVTGAQQPPGRGPRFPPVLVLWDPARGRGVARLEFGPDGITARGDTGGTARCGYEGPDSFDSIDAFLGGRVPPSRAVTSAACGRVNRAR